MQSKSVSLIMPVLFMARWPWLTQNTRIFFFFYSRSEQKNCVKHIFFFCFKKYVMYLSVWLRMSFTDLLKVFPDSGVS